MSVTSCFYIFVRPIPEEGQPEMPREGFGYISRQIGPMEPPAYRQCAWYEPDEKEQFFRGDSMWNAGKAMSALAVGVGFVVMCITLCTCCVAFELPTFDGLFWTCLLCFVAQALTFLAWGSDLCDEYECTWSSGTGMNITAAMLWVWAANMIKSFPEALPPRKNNNRGRRDPNGAPDDDGDNESPYLASNRGFQDEYTDGDEFNDFQNDDYNDGSQQGGYYDDDGNWHEPEHHGYYDPDGNWYDYDDQYYDQPSSGYFSEHADGEDPLQPQSGYYDDENTDTSGYYNDPYDQQEQPSSYHDDPSEAADHGYGYDYGADNGTGAEGDPNRSTAAMSQEELEFMAESERTMRQLD